MSANIPSLRKMFHDDPEVAHRIIDEAFKLVATQLVQLAKDAGKSQSQSQSQSQFVHVPSMTLKKLAKRAKQLLQLSAEFEGQFWYA